VFVLVDFTDYESYIKWRKISEITEKVLWLKKGTLPFHIEREKTSYLFVADQEGNASSFFIPNSKYNDYLRMYFKRLAN
jgi:gamma-glutamyltranspeptidase